MSISSALFYVPFIAMIILIQLKPELVYSVMDVEQARAMESMYDPENSALGRERDSGSDIAMFGHYIRNNTGIGSLITGGADLCLHDACIVAAAQCVAVCVAVCCAAAVTVAVLRYVLSCLALVAHVVVLLVCCLSCCCRCCCWCCCMTTSVAPVDMSNVLLPAVVGVDNLREQESVYITDMAKSFKYL